MIFTKMTEAEHWINLLSWVFLIGTLLTTMGASGIISFRMRQAKHGIPSRYRGRRRAESEVVAITRSLMRRCGIAAGERRKADTEPQVQSMADAQDKLQRITA